LLALGERSGALAHRIVMLVSAVSRPGFVRISDEAARRLDTPDT
jgi:hypothetical protein